MTALLRLAGARPSRMNAYRSIAIACAMAIGCLLLVAAVPAHAAPTSQPLAGSTFQGGDGDQAAASGLTDWQSYSALRSPESVLISLFVTIIQAVIRHPPLRILR